MRLTQIIGLFIDRVRHDFKRELRESHSVNGRSFTAIVSFFALSAGGCSINGNKPMAVDWATSNKMHRGVSPEEEAVCLAAIQRFNAAFLVAEMARVVELGQLMDVACEPIATKSGGRL